LLEVEGIRWAEREMDDGKGKIDTQWLAFVVRALWVSYLVVEQLSKLGIRTVVRIR
jgi:hypothetical protein